MGHQKYVACLEVHPRCECCSLTRPDVDLPLVASTNHLEVQFPLASSGAPAEQYRMGYTTDPNFYKSNQSKYSGS